MLSLFLRVLGQSLLTTLKCSFFIASIPLHCGTHRRIPCLRNGTAHLALKLVKRELLPFEWVSGTWLLATRITSKYHDSLLAVAQYGRPRLVDPICNTVLVK